MHCATGRINAVMDTHHLNLKVKSTHTAGNRASPVEPTLVHNTLHYSDFWWWVSHKKDHVAYFTAKCLRWLKILAKSIIDRNICSCTLDDSFTRFVNGLACDMLHIRSHCAIQTCTCKSIFKFVKFLKPLDVRVALIHSKATQWVMSRLFLLSCSHLMTPKVVCRNNRCTSSIILGLCIPIPTLNCSIHLKTLYTVRFVTAEFVGYIGKLAI